MWSPLIALAATLCFAPAAAAAGVLDAAGLLLPLPGALFYPEDPTVGNVDRASDAELQERFAGKSTLVVGGTDGIGRGIAIAMAKAGASVTIVGHSQAKADAVIGNMSAVAPFPAKQHFAAYAVDLLTVRGALGLTGQVKTSGARFDYVVLTVGMWPDREQPLSADGLDKVMSLDVLSRFIVARELLPSLNPGARVMSVLASTSRVTVPDVETVKAIANATQTKYGVLEMLAVAGAIGDAWMQAIVSQTKTDVNFIGTWPGIVDTDIIEDSKSFPWVVRQALKLFQLLFGITEEECGSIHLSVLSSPNAARRKVTFFNPLEGRYTTPLAYDADFQSWVWNFLQDFVAKHGGPGPTPTQVLV